MKLRKERSHQYGQSNIDFRSKKDDQAIKIYQPWMNKKDYGTMGTQDFHLTVDQFKKNIRPLSKIMTQKEIKTELPDQKYHKSAQFYNLNRIPIKQKMIVNNRVAELDESYKGKEKFTGDSLQIAQNSIIKNKSINKIFKTEDKLQGNQLSYLIINQ